MDKDKRDEKARKTKRERDVKMTGVIKSSPIYSIKITEENKDKLPVVPKETMKEATELFGEIIDKYFNKK